MLDRIKMLIDWRCFKAGETIEFRPGVNLLVGDQGTGKSSLLILFSSKQTKEERARIRQIEGDKCKQWSFDFEKDNFRTKTHVGKNAMAEISSRFWSHGESCWLILNNMPQGETKPGVFFMDEPDMALSVRSAHRLVRAFEKTVSFGHQIIAAVHNPIVIAAFSEVYSLEHRKWMPSQEFLESQEDQ